MMCISDKLRNSVLKRCLIGPSKDNLSVVNPTESVAGACSIFGSFVKVIVEVRSTKSRYIQDLHKCVQYFDGSSKEPSRS